MERQQEQISGGPLGGAGQAGAAVGKLRSKGRGPRKEPKGHRGVEAQLRELRTQVEQLRLQVGQVQEQLAARLPVEPGGVQGVPTRPEIPPALRKSWVEEHLDTLAQYPDCLVAIDQSKGKEGIVLHSSDEEDFTRRLLELFNQEPDARERLLVIHTSLYVDDR